MNYFPPMYTLVHDDAPFGRTSLRDGAANNNVWYHAFGMTPLEQSSNQYNTPFSYNNTYVFYSPFETTTTTYFQPLQFQSPQSPQSPQSQHQLLRSHPSRVKTGAKEYTDEKVNFFKMSDDDDDTLEAYFSSFWNMCLGKNKKCCDSCLQPYYNKKEIEKAEIELTCVICLANKKSMVFVDCGHFSVCFKCSKQCTKCPICSKTSKNVLKVYLS
jgi:Zinc finger, C3HC4 type (RING finger)